MYFMMAFPVDWHYSMGLGGSHPCAFRSELRNNSNASHCGERTIFVAMTDEGFAPPGEEGES